ncbi:MAG: hypothetical protein RIR16_303 [Actinomycetota bacterium]
MSRYRVTHKTGFKYSGSVVASYNEARMLPARDDGQLVFQSRLEIRPHTASHEYQDFFNTRTVMFEVLEPHEELQIISHSSVEIRASRTVVSNHSWEQIETAVPGSLVLTDALMQTRRTQPPADLVKFARKIKTANSPSETALAVCKKVFESMTYKHGVTGVNSVATEAWGSKIGVCQDFTHVVIGVLRAVGLPARYVSGYLHPKKNPVLGETVVGESHAWVEWWAGDWVAYDPTNDNEVIDRHIVVGRGRDYDDVAPLRGVYAGSVTSELFVSVEITKEA